MTTSLTALTVPTEARCYDIGLAVILVGIPRYNNADIVGHVVRAVNVGLAKHFPGRQAGPVTPPVARQMKRRPSPTSKASCIGSSRRTMAFPEKAVPSARSSRLRDG